MKKKYMMYMIFAAICTGINLGSQALLNFLLSPIPALNRGLTVLGRTLEYYYIIHLVIGTALGFMTKFLLDKFIVFQDDHRNMGATFRQMIIYGLFAVITTIIFWGFQLGFKMAFESDLISLTGGFIGLAIGYTLKFFLDKTFVFNNKAEA